MSVSKRDMGSLMVGGIITAIISGLIANWRDQPTIAATFTAEIDRIDEKNRQQDKEDERLSAALIETGRSLGKLEINMAVALEILRRMDDKAKRAEMRAEIEAVGLSRDAWRDVTGK